jgi:DNA-binding response OmpR family regulator
VDTRILLVEDDFTVAEVVVDYLRHAGLEPRHAVDGQTALEIAAVWRPDLVVLDLMLPAVSGPRELILRVQAVLRRPAANAAVTAAQQPVRSGQLEVRRRRAARA